MNWGWWGGFRRENWRLETAATPAVYAPYCSGALPVPFYPWVDTQ
jgi:hypothetical protein